MSLYEAFQQNTGVTANGGLTQVSSLNANVDFFFLAGASRGKDITSIFKQALLSNQEIALRTLLWARDARGGAGERQLFRDCLKELENSVEQATFEAVLLKVPELGRWDDLLVVEKSFPFVVQMVKEALEDGNGLCAKWMPRKGELAVKLRKALGWTPKYYRKRLVTLSNTVEQRMCSKEWDAINYEQVPSLAAARYQRAFSRNDAERYQNYKAKLLTGEAKINAAAVYPYDVLKALKNGETDIANAQWDSLPNYMEGCVERILPMVDVSGSMYTPVSGQTTCIDVAISLGIYISERNEGIFKDTFLSFTSEPQMHKIKGSLSDRYKFFQKNSIVGYDTNIAKAFEEVLRVAVENNLPKEEMPTKILILSDMEFNVSCIQGKDVTSFRYMQEAYQRSGYDLPGIVFWNLNGRYGNVPVAYDQTGTALVSGFSPSLMQSILGGEDFSPEGIMLKTVMDERYKI